MQCSQLDIDYSLISDATEIEESDGTGFEVYEKSRDHSNPISFSISSNGIGDSSHACSKQVRFQTNALRDFEEADTRLAEGPRTPLYVSQADPEDLTSVTVLPSSTVESQDLHLSKCTSLKNMILSNSNNLPPDISSGTSLWINTYPSERSGRPSASSSCGSDVTGAPFFRTSDHLPRLPLSPPVTDQDTISVIDVDPESSIPSALPRLGLPSSCDSSHLSLSTISAVAEVSADPYPENNSCSADLSKVRLNSTRIVLNQIQQIAGRLARSNETLPTEQARREAVKLVNEACNSLCFYNGPDGPILNPGLTVNIPEQQCTFNSLMELSVDQSEIVRQERERVARQRKRLSQMRRKASQSRPSSPPPDLLEFFDPNRHVYQSVNLHVRGLPSFAPTLSRGSDDLTFLFHDRLLADFALILP